MEVCVIKTTSEFKNLISNCFIDNQKRLYLTAFAITQNHDVAEDALQEAYLKVMKKCSQLKDIAFAKTWITRIVINQCKDMIKDNKTVSIENIELNRTYFENFDDEELQFFDLIKNLCSKEKEILTLKYFNEYSLNEISMITKIPLSTVKSKLYRALEKIKSEWRD